MKSYLASIRKGRFTATLKFSNKKGQVFKADIPLADAEGYVQGNEYPLPEGREMVAGKKDDPENPKTEPKKTEAKKPLDKE